MKKYLLLLLAALSMMRSFGQETISHELTREEYLRRERASRTAGWILLGGGLGMLAGSVATMKIDFNIAPMFGGESTPSHVDNTTSTMLAIGGVCSIFGSIVSFGAANRNMRQAASVSIINQRIPLLQQNALASKMQPTIRLRIPL